MIRQSLLLCASFAMLSLPVAAHAEDGHSKAPWGYAGAQGFQHWGDLDEQYHACKGGQKQSPINIAAYADSDLPVLKPSYQTAEAEVINNGHTHPSEHRRKRRLER